MRGFFAALVVTSALTGAAYAADQPVIGPAPAWVRPAAPLPPSNSVGDAPVRILLSDQQVALEAGRQTVYSETAVKIQTPQGLAAGNISLPWRPEVDVLTVHKVLIRRGDDVIDVLKSGQTFTVVRREQNLESAMLDGVLTANMQPEGLQVGDTLEFAMSMASSDPTLNGHVELFTAGWNGLPIARAHLRIQWPNSLPLRFRQMGLLPPLKPVKAGGMSSVELALDNVEPIVPPKGAPLRYAIGRLVEVTGFASWSDLGALMAPLYDKAAVIPAQGPLRSELDRIRALSPDPKIRVEAALALVQDRVRYVALAMGAGGYVPANAETTWARRFGDCKGKTALLLALLRELEIDAEPVAVNTITGDGTDVRLPMVGLFNHVLVRASVGGRSYWLDGTRTGDTSLDRLITPNVGWGLPLVANGAALVRMVPEPLDRPAQDVSIRIDASGGISAPAPVRIETILRGDDAIGTNMALANVVGEARDRALRDYWKGQYDFIEVKTASASFDPKTGEERLTMDGIARMDWSGDSYTTDGTSIGYRADFSRDPGPDRDAPFATPYPLYNRTTETILLPKGRCDFRLGPGIEVDQTIAGIAYRRHAAIKDGVFTIEKTERSVAPEFPASDAAEAQTALRALADRPARLRKPVNYEASEKEIAAARATTPTTATEYGRRAALFIGQGMRKEALADYSKAIELDPTDVWAWSNRSITRIDDGDLTGARADLAKAETLDPAYVQVFIAQGMLADVEHRPKAAIDAYTKAIELEPDNNYALRRRAEAHAALGDRQHEAADRLALANVMVTADPQSSWAYANRGNVMLYFGRYDDAIKDFDKALALDPKNSAALADRAMTWVWKGDLDAASKDLDAAFGSDPKSASAFRTRGLVAQRKGAWDEAIAAYTSSLDIDPNSDFALAHRADAFRAMGDDDAALSDAAAAIKLNPRRMELYLLRANILRGRGKNEASLAEATAVTAANPHQNYAYVVAGNLYSAFGRKAEAMQAYDRAIALKPEAYIYLNRGSNRPRLDLEGRRADLDAALKLDPDFVEAITEKAALQAETGDMAGAVASYSAALGKSPDAIGLLVGRGIAYARMGDMARADADFRLASGKASEAVAFNNMCWDKATAGVALESALADCETALAKAPDAADFLDSRGLVLLRLGRLDDAIADYDRALMKYPNMPTSLLGRAVAWARKGDHAKSASDAASALRIDPEIRSKFERYGLTL
ncbi:tetratricopeptide repeat protein [Sphingomonas sp.]|uniref:tetratricopeptide repeat protein n=1 Tax=Sphingomonas sp. TaxID=28214 RepID=UPI003B3B241F